MIDIGPVTAQATDLLRLLAVPVFAWAAWRDIAIRRVPNRTWVPLAALGIVLLFWDVLRAGEFARTILLQQTAISLGIVVPLAYVFWRIGGFGGADAKALMVLAVLFPSYPAYRVAPLSATVPLVETQIRVLSMTILTNAVLLAVAYPLALTAYNAVRGRFSSAMAVGLRVHWSEIPTTHGRLLERPDALSRNGLDLDALRMYLRWRGVALADIREDPDYYRDPASLPDDPNPPTGGAVRPDYELPATHRREDRGEGTPDDAPDPSPDGGAAERGSAPEEYDDPWGAEAFCEDLSRSAYGTTPEDLRDGLTVLTREDAVWVSPGIPFVVPLALGLGVALVYGDLLFRALELLGLV